MIRKYHIIIAACLCGALLTGCEETHRSPKAAARPAYTVSIEQLASRLGLSVKQAGNPYYELTNASNRVLLFTSYDGGRVYANGKMVCPVGKVIKSGGSDYVSELLAPKIREYLKNSYSASITTPKLYNGSSSKFLSGTVVIDPGHGGNDPGAQSVLGYWEKDINLKIAHKLADYLRDSGAKVVMTREGDNYPTLEGRADLANSIGADLFVSIHCDSNGDRVHRGFTVYVARQASWTSKKTGSNIEDALTNASIPSKGMRNADYKVLVQTNCPAVLVECGFMSNYDEAALLMDPWYQDKLARAIADGVTQSL